MGFDKDTNELIIFDHESGTELTRVEWDIDAEILEDQDIRITVPWFGIWKDGEVEKMIRTQ